MSPDPHRSDRLPSNSLLEGLVFAERTAQALKMEASPGPPHSHQKAAFRFQRPDEKEKMELERIQNELRSLMSQKAGILKDEEGMRELERDMERMQDELECCLPEEMIDPLSLETRNLLGTARAVVGDRNGD